MKLFCVQVPSYAKERVLELLRGSPDLPGVQSWLASMSWDLCAASAVEQSGHYNRALALC